MRLAILLAASVFASGAIAAGPSAESPDWPCVQRKVPSLTPAAVWAGPELSADADWRADPEVASLVARLAQRRLPMATAETEIEAFARTLDEEREERLTLLFAGLFEVLDAERGTIIEGIERYARRQRELADTVRAMAAQTDALRREAAPDPHAVEQAQTQLLWQTRIFNERRGSLPFICEVPRLVEQRLFALGRAISRALD